MKEKTPDDFGRALVDVGVERLGEERGLVLVSSSLTAEALAERIRQARPCAEAV